MAPRRISISTPYVLTESEVETLLKSLTERVETAIAAMVNLSLDDWRAQTRRIKAKQIVDFQNAGVLAASMVGAAKAVNELDAVAFPAVSPPTEPDDALVDRVIEGMHRKGFVLVNPTIAKGA